MARRRKSARPKKSKLKRSKRSIRASRLKRRRYSTRNRKPRRALIRQRIQPKRRRRRSRLMVTFSDGQRHIVKLSRWMASKNGTYLNAVRQLLHTNDRSPLEPFAAQSIKDVRGNEFPFETRPNTLYRLNSIPEPFHEIYQVLS